MFNEYVWNIYLKSEGRKIVDLFKNNLEENFSEEYIKAIKKMQEEYCPSSKMIKQVLNQLEDLKKDLNINIGLLKPGEYSIQSAMEYLYNILTENGYYSEKNAFEYFSE